MSDKDPKSGGGGPGGGGAAAVAGAAGGAAGAGGGANAASANGSGGNGAAGGAAGAGSLPNRDFTGPGPNGTITGDRGGADPRPTRDLFVGERLLVYSSSFVGARPGVICELHPEQGWAAVQAKLSPFSDRSTIHSGQRGVTDMGFARICVFDNVPPPSARVADFCVRTEFVSGKPPADLVGST